MGRETQQGPIRLKNLLKEAGEALSAGGYDDSLLDPLTSLPNQSQFWQHQGEGLAIFLSSDECRLYRLNRSVDERVAVGESFFVQPLISEQNATGSYFVLSLSWDEAKLYRCDGETLTSVETPILPAKFDELILPRDPEESLQNTSHRSVGNAAGTSTAMFHGQGEGEDKFDADRDHYLSIVGEEGGGGGGGGGVAAAIYNTGLPLVVAATSEVSGHFGATTKVEIDAKVDGSPSSWSDDEIRQHAHAAIASQLQPSHSALGERFGTAMSQSQASDDLDQVLEAATNGRVGELMVRDDDQHYQKTNQAVIETLRGGGDVYRCDDESMPGDDAVVAALFRF